MGRLRNIQSRYEPAKFEPELNIFSDDDPLPATNTDAKETSSIRLSIKAVPERPAVLASESISQFPVLVSLKSPLVSNDASMFKRAPIDLITVLDVSGSMDGSSGSMDGTKLDLVKQAVLFVIDNLGPSDRLSIVSFSSKAKRILRLRRMTDIGRQAAKQAVNSLHTIGSTNIVQGLKKGVQVLEERREKNPVASIIFLSDGADTDNHSKWTSSSGEPQYLHMLPASIRPRNLTRVDDSQQQTFPVHEFGFGSDHDPIAMHAIADSSGGTFSFIESFAMVQDAFANCIGGLLSVVIQDLKLTARAASHGVEIKSIPSGRYASEISNQGSEGIVIIGDMFAEEDKEFLVFMSVPKLLNIGDYEKMSILDVTCRYKDAVTEETVEIEADLVDIRRPNALSPLDTVVNMEVDRQRNRVLVLDSIAEAQRMAESRDLTGAKALLVNRRSALKQSATGQAGDDFCEWLESEMEEIEERMASMKLYEQSGRAYALAGRSAHGIQRDAPPGMKLGLIASRRTGRLRGQSAASAGAGGGYATRFITEMVQKSQQVTKKISKESSHKRNTHGIQRNAPPGTKGGLIAARRTGRLRGEQASRVGGGYATQFIKEK